MNTTHQPTQEDQPRYVIDEGVPQKKETKILSEEQERTLNKLLKAGGHALNEEERDLVYRLMDKLKQETERVRSLKKVMVHDKPLDDYLSQVSKKSNNKNQGPEAESVDGEDFDEDYEEEEPRRSRTVKHVVGFSPEEVVQRYVECWNQQKFGAEFDCFSEDFMQIDRESYVKARQTNYLQMLNRGGMRIDFGEIVSSEVQGGQAEIVATKITQEPNRKPKEDKDLYRLKIEKGHWAIHAVENLD